MPFHKAIQTYNNGYQYFATLREPIGRAISEYNYTINTKTHPFYHDLNSMSALDAFKNHAAFRQKMTNAQCWYLSGSGERTCSAAINSIVANNILVNTMNTNELLIPKAASVLGISGLEVMRRDNVAKSGSYSNTEYEDEELISFIKEMNQEDILLFDKISALYNDVEEPSYDVLKALSVAEIEPLEKGSVLDFIQKRSVSEKYLGTGWSSPESEVVWSVGKSSSMFFPVKGSNVSEIKLVVGLFVRERHPRQRIKVISGGNVREEFSLSGQGPIEVIIPFASLEKKKRDDGVYQVDLLLEFQDAISPQKLLGLKDNRNLAIKLKQIVLN